MNSPGRERLGRLGEKSEQAALDERHHRRMPRTENRLCRKTGLARATHGFEWFSLHGYNAAR
jgi:hypothetical protein